MRTRMQSKTSSSEQVSPATSCQHSIFAYSIFAHSTTRHCLKTSRQGTVMSKNCLILYQKIRFKVNREKIPKKIPQRARTQGQRHRQHSPHRCKIRKNRTFTPSEAVQFDANRRIDRHISRTRCRAHPWPRQPERPTLRPRASKRTQGRICASCAMLRRRRRDWFESPLCGEKLRAYPTIRILCRKAQIIATGYFQKF